MVIVTTVHTFRNYLENTKSTLTKKEFKSFSLWVFLRRSLQGSHWLININFMLAYLLVNFLAILRDVES